MKNKNKLLQYKGKHYKLVLRNHLHFYNCKACAQYNRCSECNEIILVSTELWGRSCQPLKSEATTDCVGHFKEADPLYQDLLKVKELTDGRKV